MILVTGATGNTGRAVIAGLVIKGVAVRAMVRRPEQATTFPAGVEVVIADMERVETLASAVDGIQQMLLISSLEPELAKLQGQMARAAQRGGVRRIVKISTEIADPTSDALIGRWHGQAEKSVEATGLHYFHLRPCNFMQNLFAFAADIKASDSFSAPLGAARISLVDVGDLAAVAVSVLLNTGLHDGCALVTGDANPGYEEFAALLSERLGKQIRYVATEPAEAMRRFLASGMPEWKARELILMYDYLQDPRHTQTNEAVRQFTGNAPRPFAAFVQEYAERLASGGALHA